MSTGVGVDWRRLGRPAWSTSHGGLVGRHHHGQVQQLRHSQGHLVPVQQHYLERGLLQLEVHPALVAAGVGGPGGLQQEAGGGRGTQVLGPPRPLGLRVCPVSAGCPAPALLLHVVKPAVKPPLVGGWDKLDQLRVERSQRLVVEPENKLRLHSAPSLADPAMQSATVIPS